MNNEMVLFSSYSLAEGSYVMLQAVRVVIAGGRVLKFVSLTVVDYIKIKRKML
jgi:hypothetical protein